MNKGFRISQRALTSFLACLLLLTIATARGQIFVANASFTNILSNLYWRVGAYTSSGSPLNADLITGMSFGTGLAVGGNTLYAYHVASDGSGTVGSYTLSGVPINPNLITGLNSGYDSFGIAVSGNDLYVISKNAGTIGRYTTSGQVINASLITGLNTPDGITVSGNNLFVSSYNGTIGEYTTSGATVNAALVTGLHPTLWGIAVQGNNIFVANTQDGTIGEYTTSGATVNPALISGLAGPVGLVVSGGSLYTGLYQAGTIAQYSTSGVLINDALISGLSSPWGIAIIPEPATVCLLSTAFGLVLMRRSKSRSARRSGSRMVRVPSTGDSHFPTQLNLYRVLVLTMQNRTDQAVCGR